IDEIFREVKTHRIRSYTLVSRSMPTRKPKLAKEYALSNADEHGRKKTTKAQHCIRAIAGEVVKSRSVHLINPGESLEVSHSPFIRKILFYKLETFNL
ncbi:MAG: hypothetical protein ACLFT3_16585, partial [Cyclobacteriaceae bacterium]